MRGLAESLIVWLWLRPALLAVAYGLDLCLGDPFGGFHPVVWIGRLISTLIHHFEKKKRGKQAALRAGRCLAAAVIAVTLVVSTVVLVLAYRIHVLFGAVIECWFAYQLLALRCLRDEAQKVERALAEDGLSAGRLAVAGIVGRDTTQLDEGGIIRATVETVAENTTDAVVAPLFYLLLGGLPMMAVYKAVNTMDSMVGYRNERFLYLGRAAAKLDDVLNYIPARLAAVCMLAAAVFSGFDAGAARRIWRRDRRRHASPNSAQTESAMAGALRIRLAGPAVYFGQAKDKPYIGDDLRTIETADISRATRLLYATSHLAWIIMFVTALIALVIWYQM